MWALLPVKLLDHTKLRLAGILTRAQRRQLSYCMVEDILDTLDQTSVVSGITVISCDDAVFSLAQDYQADVLNTGVDNGYAADVLKGVEAVSDQDIDKVLIIPADVPELDHSDLIHLDRVHEEGITLCPAEKDGGTNGLVFTPPLAVNLMYGEDSFAEFCRAAERGQVPVNITTAGGLARDIDRPDDLLTLQAQPEGNRTWRYLRSLELADS